MVECNTQQGDFERGFNNTARIVPHDVAMIAAATFRD
jgi:hypothetical protein